MRFGALRTKPQRGGVSDLLVMVCAREPTKREVELRRESEHKKRFPQIEMFWNVNGQKAQQAEASINSDQRDRDGGEKFQCRRREKGDSKDRKGSFAELFRGPCDCGRFPILGLKRQYQRQRANSVGEA